MTQVVETSAGVSGAFMARIEVWILLESEIALAGSTTISPTFGSYTAALASRSNHSVTPAASSELRGIDCQRSEKLKRQTNGPTGLLRANAKMPSIPRSRIETGFAA